jgi:hypothetical protein
VQLPLFDGLPASIFPAIVVVEHYYGGGPGLTIIGVSLLLASPAAIGGLIGSRIPREGGQTSNCTWQASWDYFSLPLPA